MLLVRARLIRTPGLHCSCKKRPTKREISQKSQNRIESIILARVAGVQASIIYDTLIA